MNFEPSKPVLNPIDWTAIVHLGQFQSGFLARTAHELRSPLSSLMSLHQLILNDLCDSPAEERECLKEAYQAATRLLKMLEVVTQVSKLEAGLSPLKLENISLPILLDELRILTELQAAHRNLHLDIEAIPDCPEASKIYTDFRVLRQVLLCLIESSLWTIETGTVRLWCIENLETGFLEINLQDDRSEQQWQEVKAFFGTPLESDQHFIQQSLPVSLPEPRSYFSLGHSLGLSQMLLNQIQGKLCLKEASSQDDRSFYLQCQIPLAISIVPLD